MNANIVWAKAFVEQLAVSGLQAVCIAPGSRSTPITLAFAHHPTIKTYLHLDERCAAFFALGLAAATEKPVAVVCTSGSAAANFYPALVEARMSHLPLLLLTADRPPELRHSGANQTIDQVKMYGDQVLWAVDMGLPDASPLALRNVQTVAARAWAVANGLVKGPVQINFPFRPPLEPEGNELSAPPSAYQINWSRGRLQPLPADVQQLANIIQEYPHGLIVCGPRCPSGEFAAAVHALSERSGYPLLADALSNVRFGYPAAISAYESFLAQVVDWSPLQVVIRFGQVPVSKWLNSYLDKVQPVHRILVRENGVWADDGHRTSWFWQVNEVEMCRHLLPLLPSRQTDWANHIRQTENRYWAGLQSGLNQTFFDGAAVAQLLEALPNGCRLFVGNSLAIRHVDQFGRGAAKRLTLFGNRGASGIDGNLSTALGVATAEPDQLLVALVGDVTFYHDLNGLLAVRQQGLKKLLIVLLNNNGGGIFRRLPIARWDPPFTELFLTPHGLDFAPAAAMYGLDFQRVGDREGLAMALAEGLTTEGVRVVEVMTDGAEDEKCRHILLQNLKTPQ